MNVFSFNQKNSSMLCIGVVHFGIKIVPPQLKITNVRSNEIKIGSSSGSPTMTTSSPGLSASNLLTISSAPFMALITRLVAIDTLPYAIDY